MLEQTPIDEGYDGDPDTIGDAEIGFLNLKKIGKSIGKAAKGVARGVASVAKSPIVQAGAGVLAVAFPAVGLPTAGAIAIANSAIKKAEKGAVSVAVVNKNLSKLKRKARAGDAKSAGAVNAMQLAIARRKAAAAGEPPPIAVVRPGAPSMRTTPVDRRPAVPSTLNAPTPRPAAVARQLAAGGTPTGARALAGIASGAAVAVPGAIVAAPRSVIRGRRVWLGRPPSGTRAIEVRGGHAVTTDGLVISGQRVFVAA